MSKKQSKFKTIYCCGCTREIQARLTNGIEIYPHRPYLSDLPFWKCDRCKNYVGCHNKTSNPTNPLGCIPTPELRAARVRLHSLIDPLWKSGLMKRKDLYKKLSDKIGKPFHVSFTRDVEEIVQASAFVIEIKQELANGV